MISSPSTRRLTPVAWKLWRHAYRVAFRALAAGHVNLALRTMLTPVGYWRFWPNAAVVDLLPASSKDILDASSPKMPSIYLASVEGRRVKATDLDDPQLMSRWTVLAQDDGAGANHNVEYQDATKLSFSDASFDAVYSISVIEHIPGNGDSDALREFARVTRPGGLILVEVPFREKAEDIYQPYDSKGVALPAPRFYERYYDAGTLVERLSPCPGLHLEGTWYTGEYSAIDPWISARQLPRWLRVPILPFEPFLARMNMWMSEKPDEGRPLAALLIYRRV